jgi:hypothetical protein
MAPLHSFRKLNLLRHGLFASALVLMGISAVPASAQMPTQLPGGVNLGQAGNLLGGLAGGNAGLPSATQAGPANTAGVLQYCVQNNYLNGGAAGSAKSALLGKLGQSGQNSSGFKQGSSGLLDTGQGKSFSLGGGGSGDSLKSQVTQHAKSLL